MSYVVLARKYRPLVFEDMVGQEHIGRTLGNAIRQDRVHHAYLFAGARGLGKTTTARIFAKGLVCEKGPTPSPCNECDQCVAVNESRSVDVMEIDGASNNSVENIRNLREQVHYLPQSARRKVYIIDEVHMLTTSAFNALLKTLEEPPPHVNFVFATTEPQKVLPTIHSRVSRLDFRRVSPEESIAHLTSILEKEGFSVAEGGLRLIARASGGSVRDTLTLLDQVIAFSDDPKSVSEEETRRVLGQADRHAIAQLATAICARDPDAVVERFDELATAGHDLMVLSMQLLEHLRDMTLVKVCRKREVLKGATEAEFAALQEQVKDIPAPTLSQLFDRFSRIIDRLPTSRVPRLLLEMGMLELANSEPLMPLGDLVDQLRAFGSGGGNTGGGGGGGRSRGRSGAPSRAPMQPEGGIEAAPSGHEDAAPTEAAAPQAAQPETAPISPAVPAAGPTFAATTTPPSAGPPAPSFAAAPAPTPETPAMTADSFGESELMKGLWNMAAGAVKAKADDPPPVPTASTGEAPNGQAAPSNCGPCSEAPPREDVIDLETTEEFSAWEQLVDRIRQVHEYVAVAVLSEVALDHLDGGIIRVLSPTRSFPAVQLTTRPEIRAIVEQAARDHFGRPFQLEVVDGEPSLPENPSISLVLAQRIAAHQRQIEAEAQEHTAIRSMVELFGAKITSTKPITTA